MSQHESAEPVPPAWIDAHCHLADPRLRPGLDAVIARSRAAGVGGWVQGGVEPDDWDRQLELARRLGAGLVPVFGLHPWWVGSQDDAAIDRALHALERRLPEARALGELGLDLHPRHASSAARQERAFRAQLALARAAAKPLVLHVVRAHAEALAVLEPSGPFPAGGIVHSFSGSPELARRYVALGLTISVGGTVTREGHAALKKTVESLPPDRLVVETDAPDQMPWLDGVADSGLNEPAHLVGIAAVIAALRKVDRADLLSKSAENLKRTFGLLARRRSDDA